MKENKCRLCGGDTTNSFTHEVLRKYPVRYFECLLCRSLQTEKPFWLPEAYEIPGVHIDVGQAARVLQTWIRLSFFLETIDFPKTVTAVDYGGSAGLLTRLMRDAGYQYFVFDPYDTGKYANYFKVDSLKDARPALITAFEVFEHFPEPADSLEAMLACNPDVIVFSTQFYEGQGPDWDYLVPDCGQHVFFYRQNALEAFASQRGYALHRASDFWVLLRRGIEQFSKIKAASNVSMPAHYPGELVNRIGYGTRETEEDFAYAKFRFQRELENLSSPIRSIIARLKARFLR